MTVMNMTVMNMTVMNMTSDEHDGDEHDGDEDDEKCLCRKGQCILSYFFPENEMSDS